MTTTVPGPRSLIPRVAVAAGLVCFAAGVYLVVVVGAGLLSGRPADRPSAVLSVIATTVVAVGLEPVRRRLRRRFASSPEDHLLRVTDEVAAAMATEDVLPRMAHALGQATSARAVAVRVYLPGAAAVVGRWPPAAQELHSDAPGTLVRAVESGGERLGDVVLHPRILRSGRPRPLAPAEERLLNDLVAHAGLAMANVRLSARLRHEVETSARRAEQLRSSRRRVLEVADAERHRLERDIHDGAQQHLVAMIVNLGLARTLCRSDPRRALTTVAALRPAACRTLAELDGLGHGIYPPSLVDGGVVGALRALAATSATPPVTVTAGDAVARWPMDVESAVYFTCAEAIQNATKHARAGGIRTHVDVAAGGVSLRVSDDGVGVDPAAAARGTGLSGMRDRLESVGGTLEVSFRPGHGTTVRGWVPLPLEPAG